MCGNCLWPNDLILSERWECWIGNLMGDPCLVDLNQYSVINTAREKINTACDIRMAKLSCASSVVPFNSIK